MGSEDQHRGGIWRESRMGKDADTDAVWCCLSLSLVRSFHWSGKWTVKYGGQSGASE